MVLAWLHDEEVITEDIMKDATQFCDWQLGVRSELFLKETDNPIACHQEKVRRALRKKPLTARALRLAVNAYRAGTEIHERALKSLLSIGEVNTRVTHRKNALEYYLPKEA
jgi:hypothetical protein